jgi:acyl transferase domain-containing protein/thioesterase domain-containing protein/acyl carrier protein
MTRDHAIAITGMACRYPGADDVAGFWENLRAGRDTLRRFSRDELIAAGLSAQTVDRDDFVPVHGVTRDGDRFDWAFFGYSRGEAASIDPQQRIFLECASAALDRASIDPARFPGWIGVYAGCDLAISPEAGRDDDELAPSLMGYEKDFLASRAAYKLGLKGPAVTVQSACSTSLVAVHTACRSLLQHECDAALAGGVSLRLPQVTGYLYREGHTLSRDGRCRPFDRDATGTVPSSGAGIVVLKRLPDAMAAGDDIVAVILASAINNDGAEKIGFTAPSVSGQRDVIRLAYALAGVDPADIGHIEAHGTGTLVGDPVEVAALTDAFHDSTARVGYCALGSVKSNIGHAGSAAGVAGLIKSALMLRHRELVPTVHFEHANPGLDLENSPFRVLTRPEPWDSAGPLLAGVSSFGFGGTNAHVVLEGPPGGPGRETGGRGPTVLCLSAATPRALRRMRTDLAAELQAGQPPALADVAWTLAAGRRRFPYRAAWCVQDRDQAIGLLSGNSEPARVENDLSVGFLFPGQGTLKPGTGRAARELLPAFRESFAGIAAITRERYGIDLDVIMRPDADPAWFLDTEHQQLGLFALGYALAMQLREWHVTPRGMLGNSIGEYVAAAVACVWDLGDAISVVRERGRAMRATRPGRMVALAMPAADAAALLTSGDRDAVAVAVEEPQRVVLAGDPARITAIFDEQARRGNQARLLDTRHAFHSPFMREAAGALRDAVSAVRHRPPSLPFVSNVTGDWVTDDLPGSPGYWTGHLTGTVRLEPGISTLLDAGCSVFVELGPGGSMAAALRRHRRWDGSRAAIPLLGASPEAEVLCLLDAAGKLWERGLDAAAETCLSGSGRRRTPLPPHRFEPSVVGGLPSALRAAPGRTAEQAPGSAPLVSPAWEETTTVSRPPYDAVLLISDPPSAAYEPMAALACPARSSAPDRQARAGFDPSSIAAALADLAVLAVSPAVVAVPPDPADPAGTSGTALQDVLQAFDAVIAAGVPLFVVAGGTADLLGEEQLSEPARTLIAWAGERGRRTPGAAFLLDADPRHPPAGLPRTDPAVVRYAWRGRRWWACAPRPVQVPADRARGAFAVVSMAHAEGARLAAGLAGSGLQVRAFAAAEAAAPGAWRAIEPVLATVPWQSRHPRLSEDSELSDRVRRYCHALIGRFVLGQAKLADGGSISEKELAKRIDPQQRLPRFAEYMLKALRDEGWLRESGEGAVEISRQAVDDIEGAAQLGRSLGGLPGLTKILDHTAGSYPGVFSGIESPLSVIFPDGRTDFIDGCLAANRIALDDSAAALGAMCAAIRAICSAWRGQPLRILEIGAGSGGLTWPLLEDWPDRAQVEYHVTDVSPLIVRRAKARAEELGLPDMRFSVLDITRDPVEQGLAAGSYDLVVGYNAVHVAPSVPQALCRLSRLLSPGGRIGLVEVTSLPPWAHAVWGLAPGWWDFDDDLRTDSVHLDADGWLRALSAAGLEDVAVVPASLRSDHIAVFAAPRTDGGGDPPDRIATMIRQQASGHDLDGVVYFASPDGRSARLWASLRAHGDVAGLPHSWVVTEDHDGLEGELARRRLDPPLAPAGAAPRQGWRHLEVSRIDDDELTAMSLLFPADGLPGVLRLRRTPAPRSGAPGPAPGVSGPPGQPTGPADQDGPAPMIPAMAPGQDKADAVRHGVAAIWRDLLGVAEAADTDDFYQLGGDSLMVVQLLATVRDRLGSTIPVAATAPRLTLGRLAELADEYRPGPPPGGAAGSASAAADSRLVTLRPTGTKQPLFFLPPAAGSSLCYRHLAPLLDPDRTFYGIESRGLHDGPVLRRLEDMAADHIELIRQVQPRGPYLLGGWSFGAMVSHEVARQLIAAGETVTLLIGVDGFQPSTGGRPLWTSPSLLARSSLLQLQARLGLGVSPQVRYRLGAAEDRVRRIGEIAGAARKNPQDMPRYVAVHNANIGAMLRYRPRPVPCDLLLLKAGATPADGARFAGRLGELYRRVVVRPLPGDHWTVLDPPNVGRVAEEIRNALGDAEPGPGRPGVTLTPAEADSP